MTLHEITERDFDRFKFLPGYFSGEVYIGVGSGWFEILYWTFLWIESHLEAIHYNEFLVTTIKEKFGALRIYTNGGDEFINRLLSDAAEMSRHTCESCGRAGKIRPLPWKSSLCLSHYKQGIQYYTTFADWQDICSWWWDWLKEKICHMLIGGF
jgi:hypothetical protein